MGRRFSLLTLECPPLSPEIWFSLPRKALTFFGAARVLALPKRAVCSKPSALWHSSKSRSAATVFFGMVVMALATYVMGNGDQPPAKHLETGPLFRIERSKNANFVQYDVQVVPDGRLDPKQPVIAYWIRRAEDGRTQELTVFQRTWYYGFKTTYDAKTNSALMEMAAKDLRPIKVHAVEGVYRGETVIDGQPAFLDKIFVTSVVSGVARKVTSVELYGKDVRTGVDRYEKITP
jgi:hypothetical protein